MPDGSQHPEGKGSPAAIRHLGPGAWWGPLRGSGSRPACAEAPDRCPRGARGTCVPTHPHTHTALPRRCGGPRAPKGRLSWTSLPRPILRVLLGQVSRGPGPQPALPLSPTPARQGGRMGSAGLFSCLRPRAQRHSSPASLQPCRPTWESASDKHLPMIKSQWQPEKPHVTWAAAGSAG